MKVLVLGATGYIGANVASAFRRAGHEVWGLTRSPAKARLLEKDEIHPVIGDMRRPESYRAAAEACDVLVQLAQDYRHDTAALDRLTVVTLLDAGRSAGQPKTLIYTGGVWDYGDTAKRMVDETAPPRPPRAVAWRPDVERLVLTATGVRTLVLRNGNVYGREGKLTNAWFEGATTKGPLIVVGSGDNHWPMVHVDDVAEGYLRAAESGISGEIFNLTDGTNPTVREMVKAIAQAAGYQGEIRFVPVAEAEKTMGPAAEALGLDAVVGSSKAATLLGWHPRHLGFLAEAATYLTAWRVSQELTGTKPASQGRAA